MRVGQRGWAMHSWNRLLGSCRCGPWWELRWRLSRHCPGRRTMSHPCKSDQSCKDNNDWMILLLMRTFKTRARSPTTFQSSSSNSCFRNFNNLSAVTLSKATQYFRAISSMSYVEFHRVLTSRGIRWGRRPWAAQAARHAGRAIVVEFMIANESFRIW